MKPIYLHGWIYRGRLKLACAVRADTAILKRAIEKGADAWVLSERLQHRPGRPPRPHAQTRAGAQAGFMGQLGGHARAETLAPAQRSQIARAAALARWAKRKP